MIAGHATGGPVVDVYVVDITDHPGLERVGAAVGTWDVLVLSAVHAPANSTLTSTDVDDWWQTFEV